VTPRRPVQDWPPLCDNPTYQDSAVRYRGQLQAVSSLKTFALVYKREQFQLAATSKMPPAWRGRYEGVWFPGLGPDFFFRLAITKYELPSRRDPASGESIATKQQRLFRGALLKAKPSVGTKPKQSTSIIVHTYSLRCMVRQSEALFIRSVAFLPNEWSDSICRGSRAGKEI
jgi:hypothetical protein